MNKQIYIHYGSCEFNPFINFPIKNRRYRNKPVGGLWASKIDAEFGWKQWNNENNYKECDPRNSFCFELHDENRLAIIRCLNDVFKLPIIKEEEEESSRFLGIYIDFEECLHQGIDAIELDWFRYKHKIPFDNPENLYWTFYGWDCDSIVVLNPDAVIQF